MPDPYPFPCGKVRQPACPSQPTPITNVVDASTTPDAPLYSYNDMLAHGSINFAKGRIDALTEQTAKAEPEGSNL